MEKHISITLKHIVWYQECVIAKLLTIFFLQIDSSTVYGWYLASLFSALKGDLSFVITYCLFLKNLFHFDLIMLLFFIAASWDGHK